MTDVCLTCATQLPDRAGKVGRPGNYCSPECRREHRLEVRRLEREVLRLESEIVDAERLLGQGVSISRRRWARSARAFLTAKLAQTRTDLAALKIGTWPS